MSRRRKSRRAGRRSRAAAMTAIAGLSGAATGAAGVAINAHPAAAANCDYHVNNPDATTSYHFYAGQYTPDYSWTGIERFIARPSGITFALGDYSDAHLAEWMGVFSDQAANAMGAMQMQTGYGVGVGNDRPPTTQTSPHIYGEVNPYGGSYHFQWWSTTTHPAGANDFHTVYKSGSIFGIPVYEAHVNDGSDFQTVVPSAIKSSNDALSAEVVTESYYVFPLTVGPPYSNGVLFGANNAQQYDTNWSLYKSSGFPNTWTEWINVPTICEDTNFRYAGSFGPYHSMFDTYHQ